MNFTQAIASCFRQYASSNGRASRSEYWYWILLTIILGIVAGIVDINILHINPYDDFQPADTVVTLVTILPSMAVTIRRLHDVNRSGWWLLIGFTIIGLIFPLLIWNVTRGTEGPNRFGPDPLTRPVSA